MLDRPPPERRRPHLPGGAPKTHLNASNDTAAGRPLQGVVHQAVVLPFPDARRACSSCGFRFRPLRPSHELCAKCFRGAMAGAHIQEALRLLKGPNQ